MEEYIEDIAEMTGYSFILEMEPEETRREVLEAEDESEYRDALKEHYRKWFRRVVEELGPAWTMFLLYYGDVKRYLPVREGNVIKVFHRERGLTAIIVEMSREAVEDDLGSFSVEGESRVAVLVTDTNVIKLVSLLDEVAAVVRGVDHVIVSGYRRGAPVALRHVAFSGFTDSVHVHSPDEKVASEIIEELRSKGMRARYDREGWLPDGKRVYYGLDVP